MPAPPPALSLMTSRMPPNALEKPANASFFEPIPFSTSRNSTALSASPNPAIAQSRIPVSHLVSELVLRNSAIGTDADERVRRICAINVQAAAQAVIWKRPPNSKQRETAVFHRVNALCALENGMTQAFIARYVSSSPSIVRTYLEGRFGGNQEVVENSLDRLIETYVRGAFDPVLAGNGQKGLSKPYAKTKGQVARERQWEQSVMNGVELHFAHISGEVKPVTVHLVALAALSVERVEGAVVKNEAERAHFGRARQYRQQLHMIQQQKIIMQQQEKLIREQDHMLRQFIPAQQQVVSQKPFLGAT